jgi:hypothetical protein
VTSRFDAVIDRVSDAPEVAPTLTRDVVRAFAVSAIGLNIALSLIDVWRLAYIDVSANAIRAAAIALAIAMPLHIRHLIFGLRGQRPPAGLWTLAALAVVNGIAFSIVGEAWVFQFASLAVSVLIVIPNVFGIALAGGVFVSPLILIGTQWYGPLPPYAGFYLAFAILWRATTQFIPLRLLSIIRALDTAGSELEARAVVQARVRIDGELRTGLTGALQQIVARGDVARAAAARDPSRASAELRELDNDSRRALTQARRVVAGYRGASVRAELDAAAALLEASGATVWVVTEDGIALDSPNEEARTAIRAAVAQALREEPNGVYRVAVTRDGAGALRVSVASGETPLHTPGERRP